MRRLSYCLAFSVGLVAVISTDVNAALQTTPKTTPIASALESTDTVLMANRLRNRGMSFRVRPSRYRRGGFSRGSCPDGAAPVVPIGEDETVAPAYLTASAHPTFLINVPELPDASGVIYVEDPNSPGRNPQVYKATFDIADQAGIIGIQMPSEAPMLQEGTTYRWRVVINCSAEGTEESTIVFSGGEIERVADIEGTREERLDYYLQEGIWQETAELIAEYRYDDPSADTDEDWAILMEASGIPQFAETPIIEMTNGRLSED
ncbi:MAG: DUF928 domain-containing protein [Leptolyngbya sp. SIO1E4]|nr:DUF928 domain-containing protein [Leptolyngbya sp. SIO1E4]